MGWGISQLWHAREGGEVADNAIGSSLGYLCARTEAGRYDSIPYILHRDGLFAWNM